MIFYTSYNTRCVEVFFLKKKIEILFNTHFASYFLYFFFEYVQKDFNQVPSVHINLTIRRRYKKLNENLHILCLDHRSKHIQ